MSKRKNALSAAKPQPYEGYALEYVNPLTGGPTLPTLSCWMQMLRPGMRTQTHRHTSTSIYPPLSMRGEKWTRRL